jgi:trans-aconitate 2-methyltransferase
MWDAQQYLRFGGERSRPFFDLIGRIGATSPGYVADLGCGPGNLTQALARRWPAAQVVGVDNSAEMITAATAAAADAGAGPGPGSGAGSGGHPAFVLADVRDWRPAVAPDVLVCNAVLQWVPGHHDLLLRWADLLAPGGWLAFQVPANFDQPHQEIVRELAGSGRWRDLLAGAELNRQAGDSEEYAALLARPGYDVDAWETSYLHILPGENPVTEWTKGTTLRPVLAALDAEQAAAFLREYGELVRQAYKPRTFGTLFPFRRVFTVLHRHGGPSHDEPGHDEAGNSY